MKKIKNKLATHIKQAAHVLKHRKLPQRFLHARVPYFSQWESRELNKDILEKSIPASNDPKWKESGAKTKEEYLTWSWVGCGMACTKMIVAHQTSKVIPLITLGK